jgi:two-component system alkaline phosphatase synthesis response regulator PhoP
MSPTILYIDDEPELPEILRYHLLRFGYQVVAASTGAAALTAIRLHAPDLIVLDLMLPDIDGFGLCEILRQHAETAAIPVIIVSGWTSADARNIGLDLGALDYVTKPFSPGLLVEKIRRLLDLRPAVPTMTG